MAFTVSSPISGLSVLEAPYAANGAGDGTLTAASADTVTWAAPDGSAGDAVTIANGETAIVLDGDDSSAYVVIKRTSSDDLSGEAIVTITGHKSTAEKLTAVQDAIELAEHEQAAGIGDKSVTRAQLGVLYEREARLERQLAHEQGDVPMAMIPDFSGGV